MAPPRPVLAMLLFAPLLGVACKGGPLGTREEVGVPEVQIRSQLGEWALAVSAEVQDASTAITAASPTRESEIATLNWRLRAVAGARAISSKLDTREALLDAWCYSVQTKLFFEEGDGLTLLGEQAALAASAGARLEQDALEIARAVLGAKDLPRVSEAVLLYCRAHPMRGLFAREPFTLSEGAQQGGFPMQGLITAPFSILKPFDETARAVHDFNKVAMGFASTLVELPDLLRWNAQLFAYDLEQRETTAALGADVARASEALERASRKVESWNTDLQAAGTALVRELEAREEPLRRTLAEARATSESIERALGEVDAIVQGLAGPVSAFRDAGSAWGETARAFGIRPTSEAPPPVEPEPEGASVAEQLELVRAGAAGLATTAGELRAGLVELRGLISSGELERASSDVEELARASADHLALRAAQLLGLAALLGLGLLLLAAALRRRSGALRGAAQKP